MSRVFIPIYLAINVSLAFYLNAKTLKTAPVRPRVGELVVHFLVLGVMGLPICIIRLLFYIVSE